MNPRPLRVLHILGELRPSGAETMLAVAAPAFEAHGVAGEVLSTGEVCGSYAERLAAAGYPVHHIPFAKSPGFFLQLWRLLRGGYDAVHIHTEQATFWVGLTTLGAGVPVVLKSIHNNFTFTGNLRLRRKVQRRILARLGIRQVSVGRSVQATERRHFGLETEIIDNWFDAARFQPPTEAEGQQARRSLGIEADEVVLASVGNCHAFKNHGELIRALALLPAGGRPLYLHVGEEEPRGPERALAQELGLGDRVRFLGSLTDVRTALYAADGFVMPSLREGLSISALEALATGLPAILTDVEGLRELGALFAGVRFAAPQAASLAAALQAFLAEDAEARWRVARDYPAVARRHFDLQAGVDAYVRIYRGG